MSTLPSFNSNSSPYGLNFNNSPYGPYGIGYNSNSSPYGLAGYNPNSSPYGTGYDSSSSPYGLAGYNSNSSLNGTDYGSISSLNGTGYGSGGLSNQNSFYNDYFSPGNGVDVFRAANAAFIAANNASRSQYGTANATVAQLKLCVNWKDLPEAHVFKIDIPGVSREDVKVEVEDYANTLTISGERKREEDGMNDKWYSFECTTGKFTRKFYLPENANVNHAKATIKDGVLTITVPKDVPEVQSIEILG